jgi:hypothetical protein
MASRVEYSISMTPIVTIDAVSNQSPAVDVIESDIGRMVGGSGSVAVGQTAHTTTGFSAGNASYYRATNSATTIATGGYDMVFIKHTGFSYSSSSALGTDARTNKLIVTIGSQEICQLSAGMALALPDFTSAAIKVTSSNSDDIAVEYAFIT